MDEQLLELKLEADANRIAAAIIDSSLGIGRSYRDDRDRWERLDAHQRELNDSLRGWV